MNDRPKIILTTAFSEYAVESYELDVVDYLLKPYSFERFLKAVSKALDKPQSESTKEKERGTVPDDIFVKSGHGYQKVELKDLDYTELCVLGKIHLTNETLAAWDEKLKNKGFYRVHRSYIVNTSKITRVTGNLIYLNNMLKIPLGRAYKRNLCKNSLYKWTFHKQKPCMFGMEVQ